MSFLTLKFSRDTFYENKELNSVIKQIEKNVRSSVSYKHYLGILREKYKLTNCSILGEITDEKASLEFHHYPYTLYDLCSIMIDYMLDNNLPVSTFTVSSRVINLHYENLVGLVLLSETVHQAVHNGSIFLNIKQVFGNIEKFNSVYEEYIYDDLKEKFNNLLDQSEKHNSTDFGNLSIKKFKKTNN